MDLDAHLAQLHALTHSKQELKSHGYVLERLSPDELELKKRCKQCGLRMRRPDKEALAKKCQYHPGKVIMARGQWSCCMRPSRQPGCEGAAKHQPRDYAPGHIAAQFQHEATPPNGPTIRPLARLLTMKQDHSRDFRAAVSLDCEMGINMDNDTELIRVTMVDYFTKEVLVDSLVQPDTKIKHFNSRYSGVWPGDMEAAIRSGRVLHGKAGARRAIWQCVGPDTIMVGHSFQNDLNALRMIHHKVVDSYILEFALRKRVEEKQEAEAKKAAEMVENNAGLGEKQETEQLGSNMSPTGKQSAEVPKNSGTLSLKNVTQLRLGRHIQFGKKGHDSLEDAVAARDLVELHACLPEGVVLEAIMRPQPAVSKAAKLAEAEQRAQCVNVTH